MTVGSTGSAVSSTASDALTAARQRVEVTGAFDEATRTALVAYQTRVGAPASGTTDAATWQLLAPGPVLSVLPGSGSAAGADGQGAPR